MEFYLIYATTVIFICVVSFRLEMVLYCVFVLYAIRMLVFLNNLVMVLVSLPMYVNVAHFCLFAVLGVVFLACFGFVRMRICGGCLLLCSIVSISCDSLCLLSVEMEYVFILLTRYQETKQTNSMA
jgi:hypothetical protein